MYLSISQLNGLGIAREHCVIKTVSGSDDGRLLHNFTGATCYVNGFILPPGTDRELVERERELYIFAVCLTYKLEHENIFFLFFPQYAFFLVFFLTLVLIFFTF